MDYDSTSDSETEIIESFAAKKKKNSILNLVIIYLRIMIY